MDRRARPGQRRPGHGPVPEELKRKAVVAVASGRLKSREAAAGLGVEASVVGKLETTDARRIQGDARDGDTREEALDGREGKAGVAPMASENMPMSASGPRDTADPSDTLASMEARLARLRARLDELDANVERQRREKKELDIEIAIRKGTLELLGKEPGADPEKPGRPREDAPRQDRWRNAGRDGQKSVARGGHRARHVSLPARRHETPRQGLRSTGARARGVRERQAQVRVQADPLGVEGHGNRGQREADHEALDRARPSAPVQEREAVRLVQGRAGQGPEEPGGRGFPRRTAEHAVGHGPHGVFHPRGQGVPVARDRLLRRHAGRLDDRHEPGLGVGQRHARRRVLHAQGRGETNHPFRPWLPLPVAGMDSHLQGAWSDAFDGREGMRSGQRGRGRVLRPEQAGVLPQAQIRGRLYGRVHQHARRLHGLVPGQEDQDGVRTRASWTVDADSVLWHDWW